MSLAHNTSSTCTRCASWLPVGTPSCATCGQPTGGAVGAYGGPVVVVAAKSAGVAVLLTVFWMGAGHLYAGRIGTGVALMVFDFVLGLLALTGIGFLLAFPVWIVSCAIAAYLATEAVGAFNRRNGVVVR